MSRDPKKLLGGHATDTLTEDERRELMRAALDNQELFDAIVEEEGLRELLESPGARREVLEALEAPTAWERFRSWFARPATFGDLAAVAATLLVVFVGYLMFLAPPPEGGGSATARPGAAAVSPAVLASLLDLPARAALPASLEPAADDRSLRVSTGQPVILRVRLAAPAHALVVAEAGEGTPSQVFPTVGAPPFRVSFASEASPAVFPVTVVAPASPGTLRLRLVAAPVEVDLAALSPSDIDGLASRLTLVDLTYEVVAP